MYLNGSAARYAHTPERVAAMINLPVEVLDPFRAFGALDGFTPQSGVTHGIALAAGLACLGALGPYPLGHGWPVWLLYALLPTYFLLLCWRPALWLFCLPALLPVLDLAPLPSMSRLFLPNGSVLTAVQVDVLAAVWLL